MCLRPPNARDLKQFFDGAEKLEPRRAEVRERGVAPSSSLRVLSGPERRRHV